jgi:hypothetical protein
MRLLRELYYGTSMVRYCVSTAVDNIVVLIAEGPGYAFTRD